MPDNRSLPLAEAPCGWAGSMGRSPRSCPRATPWTSLPEAGPSDPLSWPPASHPGVQEALTVMLPKRELKDYLRHDLSPDS